MKKMITQTLIVMAIILGCLKAEAQQSISGSFTSEGDTRSYIGAVPDNPTNSMRLVILFCGATESASEMELRGFNDVLGDSTLVIYPEPSNANFGFDNTNGVDDFQMVEDLISEVTAAYSVNENDICIGGFSNGAVFSHKLACDFNATNSGRAYRFKAFAAVSGAMEQGTANTSSCDIAEELPAILFHGTADPVIPYVGGAVGFPLNITAEPAETVSAFWAADINDCSISPSVIPIADTDTSDGSTVELLEYACDASKATLLYRINGGMHAWPSGNANFDITQNRNLDINASALIAEFFANIAADSTADTSVTTGIQTSEQFENSLSVYPNPAIDRLHIKSLATIVRIEVYSTRGEMILSQTGHRNTLMLADAAPGLYFIHLETASGVMTKKVLKQ